MHKSLIDLQNAVKFRDEQKKSEEAEPHDSPEPIAEGEPIAEIKEQRQRKQSLEHQLAELIAKDKELNLRLKILKKKEQIEKVQLRFDQITEEESYYTDMPDSKGYVQLRDEKWQNDFQELIIKLKNIELDEFNGTVDLQTSQEAKANVTKQIKILISIKKKTSTKNTFNKLKRGLQKTFKGIGSFSNEMSKLSNELGKFGNQVGGGQGKNTTDWNSFFSDKPKTTKTTKTTKKRKSRKTKKKSKKSKTTKKRKKSKTNTQKETSNDFGAFGGF